MTAHQLAQYLLRCPDLPVYINGWGSDEGGAGAEVTGGILVPRDGFDKLPERINLIYDGPEWDGVGRPAASGGE